MYELASIIVRQNCYGFFTRNYANLTPFLHRHRYHSYCRTRAGDPGLDLNREIVMNKLFKNAGLGVALATGVLMVQGCAQTPLATSAKNADVTAAYKAIAASKNQQDTIAQLVADGKNVDTVISVATVAGVPSATIAAALPAVSESRLAADATAAQNDPVAYSPAAAAGVSQGDSGFQSHSARSLRQSF
jgi:hypothetical protein